MFAHVRHRAGNDKIKLAIAGKIFVNGDGAGLAGFLGREIGGQIFVFHLDETNCGLRGVLVDGSDCCHRFTDAADFVLGEKRLVLDRLTVDPRRVFPCDHGHYARILFGFLDVNALDPGVRLRTKQHLSVKHIGKDQIVAVNRLPGDLLTGIDSRDGFADDCELFHL